MYSVLDALRGITTLVVTRTATSLERYFSILVCSITTACTLLRLFHYIYLWYTRSMHRSSSPFAVFLDHLTFLMVLLNMWCMSIIPGMQAWFVGFVTLGGAMLSGFCLDEACTQFMTWESEARSYFGHKKSIHNARDKKTREELVARAKEMVEDNGGKYTEWLFDEDGNENGVARLVLRTAKKD